MSMKPIKQAVAESVNEECDIVNASVESFEVQPVKVRQFQVAWTVFEYAGKEGYRRASQAVWFYDKEYAERQLKVLQRYYPHSVYALRCSKETDRRLQG